MKRNPLGFLVRLTSFFRKEILEVLRQPKLVLTLILGPFLILLLFAIGYTSSQEPLRTLLVASDQNELANEIEAQIGQVEDLIEYVGRTSDGEEMMQLLEDQEIDLAFLIPNEAMETIRGDEKVQLDFYHNQIDPNQASYSRIVAQNITQLINKEVLKTLAQESDIEEAVSISPEVLTEPFTYQSYTVAGMSIAPTDFLTPGVIVLLLQHMMTTLAALSIVREVRTGTMELYRVSPLKAIEIIISKYISYILLGILIAIALFLVTVYGLKMPVLGSLIHVGLIFLAVLFSSIGIGFFISLVSKTDTEAVQFAMIALLFSVFFSGFFIDLRYILAPVSYISYLIPTTYGKNLLQDILLRGYAMDWRLFAILLGMGVLFFIISWILLSVRMKKEE